jgi:hypothetical protein
MSAGLDDWRAAAKNAEGSARLCRDDIDCFELQGFLEFDISKCAGKIRGWQHKQSIAFGSGD